MTRFLANRRFYDERIEADDVYATGCLFDGCVVVLTKASGASFVGCNFRECMLVGDQWPNWMRKAGVWKASE